MPGVFTVIVTVSSGPVEVTERISGLDALRGVALLGILLANVRQMFLPWDVGEYDVPLGIGKRLAWIDWQFYHSLIDLKFLTLFSLLFGIGFALQSERIASRGSGFASIYLRRLLILAGIGILHGLLLYPAEVLLPYAATGLFLFFFRKASPDNMIRAGLSLLGITIIWSYQLSSLGRFHPGITAAAAVMLIASMILLWPGKQRAALGAWVGILLAAACWMTFLSDFTATSSVTAEYQEAQKQLQTLTSTDASAWPEELRVRRQGSFGSLMKLHAGQYALILLYFAILLLWRTLALFLIGAALFRSGAITKATPGTWRLVAVIGLGTGLPLSLLSTWMCGLEIEGYADWRLPEFLHSLSALPLAAGIAGAVFLLHRKEAGRLFWKRIEAAGRMALTNYVGQSFVLATLAEPWGFDLYARLGGPVLTALALITFAVLAQFSHLWLSRFRMGPLEWLWRCGTYGRWLPITHAQ